MSNLYGKIDVSLPRKPSMIEAGPVARMLYIQCFLYARENLTDGLIDARVLQLVAVDIKSPNRHMKKLVEVGVLEEVDGVGWRIPIDTWTEFNPTRSEVEETRAQKAEAGIIGNHKRWHTATEPNRSCPLCKDAGWVRTLVAPCDTGAKRSGSPEPEPEPENYLPDESGGSRTARDELWDTLTAEIGQVSTPTERSNRGKTVKELTAAGATPDEIVRRCGQYRAKYPRLDLTDAALRKHWSSLEPARQGGYSIRDGVVADPFADW